MPRTEREVAAPYRQRQPHLLQDSSESKRAGEPFLATVLGRGPGCLWGGQGATDRCQGGVWFLPETGGRGSWEPGQRVLASPLAQGAGAGAGDRPTMGIKGRKSKAPSLPEGASKGPVLEDSTWEAKQYGPRRTGSGSREGRGCWEARRYHLALTVKSTSSGRGWGSRTKPEVVQLPQSCPLLPQGDPGLWQY